MPDLRSASRLALAAAVTAAALGVSPIFSAADAGGGGGAALAKKS